LYLDGFRSGRKAPAVCMAYLDLDIGRSSLAHQLSVVGAVLLLVGGLPLRHALRIANLDLVRYAVRYVRYTSMSATD
jgi:hypothetical protein